MSNREIIFPKKKKTPNKAIVYFLLIELRFALSV